MKLLKDILYKVEIQSVIGKTDVDINKIEFNSKKIIKNDLFIREAVNLLDNQDKYREILSKN